jgi:hypothetical protein
VEQCGVDLVPFIAQTLDDLGRAEVVVLFSRGSDRKPFAPF